jgi:hypothetical protein
MPLDDRQLEFFFQLNCCSRSPHVTSSLTRGWVGLVRICLVFYQVYISHIEHVIENSSVCIIYKFCVSPGFAEQIMLNLLVLRYDGSLFAWTVVSLTASKFKPLIFSMSVFALTYTVNMFILMTNGFRKGPQNTYVLILRHDAWKIVHCYATAT